MVSLKEYKKLIEERPRKFSAEEVDYRDAEDMRLLSVHSLLRESARQIWCL